MKWFEFLFLVRKGMRSNLMFKEESDLSVAKIRYGMHKNDAFLFDKMRIYSFFLSSFASFSFSSFTRVSECECVKNQRNTYSKSYGKINTQALDVLILRHTKLCI